MRTLLLIVALAAILAGVYEFKSRRDRFLDLASQQEEQETRHAQRATYYLARAELVEAMARLTKKLAGVSAEPKALARRVRPRDRYPLPLSDAERFPDPEERPEQRAAKDVANFEKEAAFYRDRAAESLAWVAIHARAKQSYRRAARYPWLRHEPESEPPPARLSR